MANATIEAIARDYCRRIGTDPDEVIGTADRQHPTLARHIPRWEFAADQVRAAVAMRDAIDSVRLATATTTTV